MGHEYMEMRNTSAAIQAYRCGSACCRRCSLTASTWRVLRLLLLSSEFRHAIEVNKRDYRAWYGLGQTYEILKMPFYCLYYYRKAHQLRYSEQSHHLIHRKHIELLQHIFHSDVV